MMYDVIYEFIKSEVSVLEGLKCSAAIKRTIADHVPDKHLGSWVKRLICLIWAMVNRRV